MSHICGIPSDIIYFLFIGIINMFIIWGKNQIFLAIDNFLYSVNVGVYRIRRYFNPNLLERPFMIYQLNNYSHKKEIIKNL